MRPNNRTPSKKNSDATEKRETCIYNYQHIQRRSILNLEVKFSRLPSSCATASKRSRSVRVREVSSLSSCGVIHFSRSVLSWEDRLLLFNQGLHDEAVCFFLFLGPLANFTAIETCPRGRHIHTKKKTTILLTRNRLGKKKQQ